MRQWKPRKGDKFRAVSKITGREFRGGKIGILICTGSSCNRLFATDPNDNILEFDFTVWRFGLEGGD